MVRHLHVDSFSKGIRLRKGDCYPFRRESFSGDPRLKWLNDFVTFLKEWRECKDQRALDQRLTLDTHKAMIQTTLSKIKMMEYVFSSFDSVKYIMLANTSNDPIEHQFGRYRQYRGGNYRVSMQQILENEKKIRDRRFLHAVLSGKSIMPEGRSKANENECDGLTVEVFEQLCDEIIDTGSYIEYIGRLQPEAIEWVAGHCARKAAEIGKNECEGCMSLLISMPDEVVMNEYHKRMNRGKCVVPSEFSLNLVLDACAIVLNIQNDDSLNKVFTQFRVN